MYEKKNVKEPEKERKEKFKNERTDDSTQRGRKKDGAEITLLSTQLKQEWIYQVVRNFGVERKKETKVCFNNISLM